MNFCIFKKIAKLVLKSLLFLFLTALTQIGGLIYILTELFVKRNIRKYRFKKIGVFLITYVFITFLIVPYIAPLFGREKIKDTTQIKAHSFVTKLLNRNYVRPELYIALEKIGSSFQQSNPEIALVYLDANFPFINGFPLLPHLSHNDGKKIDISFIYQNQNNKITNKKPSISGYGVFEPSIQKEYDQPLVCKQKGYWQYDFTKYITFGTINKGLKISKKATKDLLLAIVKQKKIKKIFIEPHLKNRLEVQSAKIRFHGCQAVRHDDHIHIQLK
ncbi:hypothetical protein ATE84_3598 [Aquimarina sp. MAR_2010_214]|uniref:hypothetical protein n=1 Tax=Aquimarina sp. MAR_2010_214 TaxID=1250026 RepID=UPI000CA9B2F0|nr:hypothetical protein [Aquimarina sp. MAR_2010_214]PKV51513.1 hypothetical protein ATE84_3598 [Aquimarina sp. MAR_2010_214]